MTSNRIDFGPSLGALSLEDWLAEVAELVKERGRLHRLGPRHFGVLAEHGRTLLVTFESLQGIFAFSPLAQPMGWDLTRRFGWSSLSLISHGETWFRDTAVCDFFDSLTDEGFFDRFDRVLFYGAGAGAYAAAAYSVAAPGARVLAIQPQATLCTARAGWDQRFPQMRRTDFSSRYGYAPHMIEAAEQVWLVFDPLETEDSMHAALFDAPHVTPLRMRAMGASLQTDLAQMQVLPDLIEQAAAGALTRTSFARANRARRDHLPYLHRLLRLLEREDRDALISRLCHHVTARMDAPRFADRLHKRAVSQ
jgi:hypothetical protein